MHLVMIVKGDSTGHTITKDIRGRPGKNIGMRSSNQNVGVLEQTVDGNSQKRADKGEDHHCCCLGINLGLCILDTIPYRPMSGGSDGKQLDSSAAKNAICLSVIELILVVCVRDVGYTPT